MAPSSLYLSMEYFAMLKCEIMLVLWHCGCIGSKHLFSTSLSSQLLFDGVWIQLSVTPPHMIPSFCQLDILFCKLNFPRRHPPSKKVFLANVRVETSDSNPFQDFATMVTRRLILISNFSLRASHSISIPLGQSMMCQEGEREKVGLVRVFEYPPSPGPGAV